MLTWFPKIEYTWSERFCMNVLKAGHLPRHVAFIMDGNRRYSKEHDMSQKEGYMLGFQAAGRALAWCKEMGIDETSYYLFSIENFKRSKEERGNFMRQQHFLHSLLVTSDREEAKKFGLRMRYLGDVSLFPDDLRKLFAEIELATRDNDKHTVNMCIGYTSREEMTNAVRELREGVQEGILEKTDISEQLLEKCFYSGPEGIPVDILVRTSGESRLSDFMMWQCSYASISFFEANWPDLSIWHLFVAILQYQLNKLKLLNKAMTAARARETPGISSERIEEFLNLLSVKRTKALQETAIC